jgi:hypothetical protein
LTSALVGDEWLASRLGRFAPGERATGTHWIGGWVVFRAGLDDMETHNINIHDINVNLFQVYNLYLRLVFV